MPLISEVLERENIESLLQTTRLGRSAWGNEVWESIGSTNSRAAELAAEGAPQGLFVAARQQTAGRGRLGRTWVSPQDAGIYISMLLRPTELTGGDLAPITLACGVAAARAVETVAGVRLGLKWVNDLVCEGRKVGGILAEMPSAPNGSSVAPSQRALIVGFGLNLKLNSDEIPEDLAEKMGWLNRFTEHPVNPNLLAAQLLLEVETAYDLLLNKSVNVVLDQWRSLSVTLGREIIATSGSSTITGTAIDIDEAGALIVQATDGQMHHVHAGEVTVRMKDGKYI